MCLKNSDAVIGVPSKVLSLDSVESLMMELYGTKVELACEVVVEKGP